jgi:hypothetical protein
VSSLPSALTLSFWCGYWSDLTHPLLMQSEKNEVYFLLVIAQGVWYSIRAARA